MNMHRKSSKSKACVLQIESSELGNQVHLPRVNLLEPRAIPLLPGIPLCRVPDIWHSAKHMTLGKDTVSGSGRRKVNKFWTGDEDYGCEQGYSGRLWPWNECTRLINLSTRRYF
jgi:hypothetical protein